MGRDLSWYIIPKTLTHDASKQTLTHDASKPMCMHLEFEPEKDDKSDLLYAHFYPVDDDRKDEYDIHERRIRCKDLEYSCLEDRKKEWCSLCHLYMSGELYDSKLVLDKYNVQHSNSNPIWDSDWNIKGFYMGSSTTPFLRKFDQRRHMYREINADDVVHVVRRVECLGDPVRTSDKLALEETMRVLQFLNQWVERDDVMMIMQDEL